MHQLSKISLNNYLMYDEAEFKFKKGISVVGGANRSGKSLMFSGLAPLLYHKNQGGGTLPASSQLTLDWKRDDETFSWKATTSKSTKFSLTNNDKDLSTHKMSDAYAAIRENWLLSYDLFTSTVVLDGTKPHPLTIGKASIMNQWLSDVLNISTIYDSYHSEIQDRLSQSKEARVALNVLKEELASIVPEEHGSEKITKKKYEASQAFIDSYSSVKNVESLKEMVASLKLRLKVDDDLDYDSLLEEKYDIKAKLQRLKDKLEANDSNKKLLDKIREAKQFVSKNKKKLNPKAEKELREIQSKKSKYEDALDTYESQKSLRSKIEKCRKDLDSEKLSNQLSKLSDSIVIIESQLESFEKPKDGVCSSCGTQVEIKDVKRRRDNLKSKLVELKAKQDKTTKLMKEADLYARKSELVKKPEWPTKYSNQEDKLEKQVKLAEAYKKRADFIDDNKGAKVYDEKQLKSELKSTLSKKAKIKSLLKKAKKTKDMISDIMPKHRKLSKKECKQLLEKHNKKLSKHDPKADELLEKHTNIVNNYIYQERALKSIRANQNRLKDKIELIKPSAEDYEALQALNKAFGKSGLRLVQLQEAANMLSIKLTELSSMMFDDPYTFNIEVKERQMSIMIERRGQVGGLETLSGSESRVWTLICGFALLHVVPKQYRVDTMVLDEIEANMDDKSRDRYATEVLPELQKIVPKLVVVTPQISGELNVNPDFEYRVSHNAGVSSIHRI